MYEKYTCSSWPLSAIKLSWSYSLVIKLSVNNKGGLINKFPW